jgi:hypothetical protein
LEERKGFQVFQVDIESLEQVIEFDDLLEAR